MPCILFAQTKIVTLAEDSWPPYIRGKEDGSNASGGVAVNIIQDIFKQIDGVDVEFKLFPWMRVLKSVKEGQLDGCILLKKTPERLEYMEFTAPLLDDQLLLWYKPSHFPDGFSWEKYTDLSDYKIAGQLGYSYGNDWDRAVENKVISVYEVDSGLQLMAMLMSDRVDLIVMNKMVGYAYMKEEGFKNKFLAAEKPIESNTLYISFSKKSWAKKLIPEINRIISKMKQDGTIDYYLKNIDS